VSETESSDEIEWREDEEAMLIALFRYGVIAPLVEREHFEPGEVSRLAQEICQQKRYLPGTGKIEVGLRTVYRWRKLYLEGGMPALRPRLRCDRGHSRKIPDDVLERAAQLRRENPERWTKTLLDILRREHTIPTGVSFHRSTLDRHLDRAGASRRSLRVLDERVMTRMKFDNFGDLWVGDYHHGPLVVGPDGILRTSKLGAFIDHATRYPVAHRYYLAEDLPSLRHCLLCALLRWGVAKKVYVDRGAVYRAEQLAYSLDRIGTKLIHSRAYYSEGRGVIEKWWQVAGQFESEVRLYPEPLTVHELNRLWEAYCEPRYCQEPHSEIGKAPHEAIQGVEPRPIDPDVLRELFLVGQKRKVHKKDSCVSVEGRRFRVDASLRNRQVTVRYDLQDLSSVLIFHEGKRIHRAFPQVPNEPPEPHREKEAPPPPSVDYLALLREDYDRQLLAHARPLAYREFRLEPAFDAPRFVETVTQLAGLRSSNRALQDELESFWESYGPLPEELVRIGTEHAARLHGRGRHPRIYLHAIRTLVLAHWKSRDNQE
jgi:putative transposase